MAYTKFYSAWATSDQLTGEAWNHLETEWDEIKADADLHQHDSRYYTKTLADSTFFALTTSVTLGMDADLLDGNHFSALVAAVMPLGAIMIWSGTDANVPSGWHICDGGTYGGKVAPDLRDRFVYGAGSGEGYYEPGHTGGVATWDGTITPTGTVAVGNHVLTTAELPVHDHEFTDYYSALIGASGLYGDYSNSIYYRNTAIEVQASGDGAHGHTGSTASLVAIDVRPTYYSLFYIMKYS
jgi:hypothetical protein